MRSYVAFITLFLLSACNTSTLEKPKLLNPVDTIKLNKIDVKFKTNHPHWKAYLFTFNQPIELSSSFNINILHVVYSSSNVNMESNAKICLMAKDSCFSYNFYLKNYTSSNLSIKDYRSPKTVNPDSSLQHDKILYALDESQNLQLFNNKLFSQEQVFLEPKVQTVNAVSDNNLTAYYVQPGSIESMLIRFSKRNHKNVFLISTNLLKDKHNNVVANGTKICFQGFLGDKLSKTYASTINGIATIELPIDIFLGYNFKAVCNTTNSNTIILN